MNKNILRGIYAELNRLGDWIDDLDRRVHRLEEDQTMHWKDLDIVQPDCYTTSHEDSDPATGSSGER